MGLARRDQGARRRRCRDIGDDERHRDRPQPPSARRVAAGRYRFLCSSSSAMHTDIASSSLRELDAVALATNATISMKRGTKEPKGYPLCGSHNAVGAQRTLDDCGTAVENLCIIPAKAQTGFQQQLKTFLPNQSRATSCEPQRTLQQRCSLRTPAAP